MIYVEQGGRCGNQMFLYAFARELQYIYGNEDICFNFYKLKSEGEKADSNETYVDALLQFRVNPYKSVYQKKDMVYLHGNLFQIVIYALYKTIYCNIPCKERSTFYRRQEKAQPFLNRLGIYSLFHGYSPIKKTVFKNKFVDGTYEDKLWFKDVADKIRCELQPKESNANDLDLYRTIISNQSVCVSCRRGDYLLKENRKIRNVCTEKYYKEATDLVKKKLEKPIFVFFSDDIEWVKNNKTYFFNDPDNEVCFYESGNDSLSQLLLLMSSCKNFIMSNSTFCWWAQYLSCSVDGIVVSPVRWFNMKGYKHQLIDDSWYLIDGGIDE